LKCLFADCGWTTGRAEAHGIAVPRIEQAFRILNESNGNVLLEEFFDSGQVGGVCLVVRRSCCRLGIAGVVADGESGKEGDDANSEAGLIGRP